MIAESKQSRFERLLSLAKVILRTRDEDAIAETSLRLWESLTYHAGDEDALHVRRGINAGRKSLRQTPLIVKLYDLHKYPNARVNEEGLREVAECLPKFDKPRCFVSLDHQPACGDNLASCAIVDDLLTVLPEEQCRAFVYHCLDGLSTKATAELLGMSERNVYYLVTKAKRRLWKEIR